MIVSRLRVCGFRGVREPIDLTLARGFVIVTGKNGTGKSTLCDAIEFALAGHFRDSAHKEKGETLADYIWWRGEKQASERYVALTLKLTDGSEVTITRTPQGVTLEGADNLVDLVCEKESAPQDAIERLCRTSIIRDEEITQWSVDLPETDRFEFVRHALGTTDFVDLEKRALEVHNILDGRLRQMQSDYFVQRNRVSDLTARVSATRASIHISAGVNDAEAALRALLRIESGVAFQQLLETASKRTAEWRLQLDTIFRNLERRKKLEQQTATSQSELRIAEVQRLKQQVEIIQSKIMLFETELATVEKQIEEQRRSQPTLTAFAQLTENGAFLGLQDGTRCPLCDSVMEKEAFHSHIVAIRTRLEKAATIAMELTARRTTISNDVSAQRQELRILERKLQAEEEIQKRAENEFREIAAEIAAVGLQIPSDIDSMEKHAEEIRGKLSQLDRLVAVLESSRIYEQVGVLEGELKTSRQAADVNERAMEAIAKAAQKAKDGVATIRRMRGELIDESLAELSPLMAELYLRLRPHLDWQQINYRLRGDVRRFLSFTVGDGLNPSFVFSSGQRRAAGIAFLFAVHLARPWCKLKSLILDDPIQHVDDFRALNLTEILAAVRRAGEQVVCTTEDEALGELMCRRLRSSATAEGQHVKMDYDSERGSFIQSIREVKPLPSTVLIPA
jgi:chromosome segregation protein